MRYRLLDDIRGITLISMILYHGTWDLVYLCGVNWPWYQSSLAYLWQQSICWTFILLSGFCWSFGHRKWKRGLTVLGASVLVSCVTCVFLWDDRIIFGVLTLLGSAMLLMIPLETLLRHARPIPGLLISFGLFFVTRDINKKYLGFEHLHFAHIPKCFYRNYVTTYFGFMHKGFFSSDYFSLIPWIFLFVSGYFVYRILKERDLLQIFQAERYRIFSSLPVKYDLLAFFGRHSIWVYLLHQIILYLLCMLIFHIGI